MLKSLFIITMGSILELYRKRGTSSVTLMQICMVIFLIYQHVSRGHLINKTLIAFNYWVGSDYWMIWRLDSRAKRGKDLEDPQKLRSRPAKLVKLTWSLRLCQKSKHCFLKEETVKHLEKQYSLKDHIRGPWRSIVNPIINLNTPRINIWWCWKHWLRQPKRKEPRRFLLNRHRHRGKIRMNHLVPNWILLASHNGLGLTIP